MSVIYPITFYHIKLEYFNVLLAYKVQILQCLAKSSIKKVHPSRKDGLFSWRRQKSRLTGRMTMTFAIKVHGKVATLVVVSTPLKNIKVSWDDSSQYKEKMFQTTNQACMNICSCSMVWARWLILLQRAFFDSFLLMPKQSAATLSKTRPLPRVIVSPPSFLYVTLGVAITRDITTGLPKLYSTVIPILTCRMVPPSYKLVYKPH